MCCCCRLLFAQDILAELGVNKVGDAIAVMKHSREFHHQVGCHDYTIPAGCVVMCVLVGSGAA